MPDITMHAIQAEIDTLTRKADRLRSTLDGVEQRRNALQLTLQHFQEPPPTKKRKRPVTLDVESSELQGKTLEEALIYIAEHNDEIVPSTAAREVLIDAGILKGTQIGHTLWAALGNSERFTREARGRYRLLPDPDDIVEF